jgi:phosphinothricin acetyltransferase
MEASTAAGFRQMLALIGDAKNMASIRLHKAAGFGEVGTMRSVGFKHGRWLDVVIMQRALGAGDTSAPDR